MSIREGHGNGSGVPRIEVLPPDELPAPVPAVAVVAEPAIVRQLAGRVTLESAKVLGRRGGLAKATASAKRRAEAEAKAAEEAERTRLMAALGLATLAADAPFLPYRHAGDAFVTSHLASLAVQAGGEVGPGPASIVASAGVQLAASRYFSDRAAATGDASLFTLASSLANASRQNLLAAYELGVREAQARSKAATTPRNAPWFLPAKKAGAK